MEPSLSPQDSSPNTSEQQYQASDQQVVQSPLASPQQHTILPTTYIAGILALAAAILPLLAWGFAAVFNIKGWASDPLTILPIILTTLFVLSVQYWYVALPVIASIICGITLSLVKRQWIGVSAILLLISVPLSIFIFYLTITASDEEFSG